MPFPHPLKINEGIIEPNSKPKATVMYTFGMLLISGIKEKEQREDRRTVAEQQRK